jgi:hypothetical protein
VVNHQILCFVLLLQCLEPHCFNIYNEFDLQRSLCELNMNLMEAEYGFEGSGHLDFV